MSDQRKMPVLPVAAYTQQDCFEKEQEKIFSNTWQLAGLREDITQPGQFISVQAGLNNIFIVMGRDHRLRAFHNMCRHRGTQLLRAVGKAQKLITCPYHDWTYDLEGKLVSVPEEKTEFKNLDKSCLGLKRAAVDVWRGMLFVHPDPDQQGRIMDWFGAIEPYLGPHNVDALVEDPSSATEEIIEANWKIVVENYIDVYHLSHLHSGTLAMYDHAKADYGFIGAHFAFWEPLSQDYAADLKTKAPLPLIVKPQEAGAWVPMLFPGIGLAETETTWTLFHVIPISAQRTKVVTRTKVKDAGSWDYLKQGWKSYDYWKAKSAGKVPIDQAIDDTDPLVSGDVMAEDKYVCEQQQKSLKSPYFEVGATAENQESPVRDHQKIVWSYLKGA